MRIFSSLKFEKHARIRALVLLSQSPVILTVMFQQTVLLKSIYTRLLKNFWKREISLMKNSYQQPIKCKMITSEKSFLVLNNIWIAQGVPNQRRKDNFKLWNGGFSSLSYSYVPQPRTNKIIPTCIEVISNTVPATSTRDQSSRKTVYKRPTRPIVSL